MDTIAITRLRIVVARDRKLEDILRDNSVSTMLITAYFRRVAGDFLTDTLQQPLIEVVEELRRQSLIGASPTTSPGSSPPRNMTEPQATGLGGPPSLLVTAAATTNGDTTTIDPTSVETAQLLTKKVHFAVQDLLEAIFRCQDHVPEKLREFAAMLRSEVDMFVMEMESTGNFRYSTAGDSAPASPAKDAVLLTKACAEGPVVLSTRNSNSPRSPRKSPGASGMLHGNSALRRSQVALADTPPEADETAIDAALSNMDIRTDVSVVSSRRASISEHIVGTLFFLRFFVPGRKRSGCMWWIVLSLPDARYPCSHRLSRIRRHRQARFERRCAQGSHPWRQTHQWFLQ